MANYWRVHPDWRKTRDENRLWRWCQDAECPLEHRLYEPFVSVGPVVGKWEGVKHK